MKNFWICFIPVLLLDMFTWRDIGLRLGKDELLYADEWVTGLYYRGENGGSDSLSPVSEFLMDKDVFTGKTSDEYFIITRETGKTDLFSSSAERDRVLIRQFSLSLEDLKEPPWYAALRDLTFYPYNLIYYTILIGVFLRSYKNKLHNIPATEQVGAGRRYPCKLKNKTIAERMGAFGVPEYLALLL